MWAHHWPFTSQPCYLLEDLHDIGHSQCSSEASWEAHPPPRHTVGPTAHSSSAWSRRVPLAYPGFPQSVSSLISDISGVQTVLGRFRTSCVALFAPLLNVLGIDSLGVRFALVSESSKAYPLNAPVDIVGLLGCSAPLVNHQESQSRGFSHGRQGHHEDRLPPVRAASGRCR